MSGGAYTRIISNLVAERGSISKSAEEGLAAGDGDDKDIDSREACVKDDDEISTLVQNNSKSIGTSVGSNSTTTSRDIGDEDVAKGAAAEAKALAEAYQTVVDSILRGEDELSELQALQSELMDHQIATQRKLQRVILLQVRMERGREMQFTVPHTNEIMLE